jgi:hypothetical protein
MKGSTADMLKEFEHWLAYQIQIYRGMKSHHHCVGTNTTHERILVPAIVCWVNGYTRRSLSPASDLHLKRVLAVFPRQNRLSYRALWANETKWEVTLSVVDLTETAKQRTRKCCNAIISLLTAMRRKVVIDVHVRSIIVQMVWTTRNSRASWPMQSDEEGH